MPSKDLDQPPHSYSLIRILSILDLQGCKTSSCGFGMTSEGVGVDLIELSY